MKLTIRKMHNGNVVEEIEKTFNHVEDYVAYLDSLGVDMSLEDASFDMQQSEVVYRLPVLAKEIQ